MKSKEYKILSIDGGGVRGLYPAKLLEYIEKDLGQSLGELFDLIVGTSVGSILASIIALNIPVSDVIHLIKKRSTDIFDKNGPSVSVLSSSIYKSEKLYDLIKELVGNKGFSDLNTNLLLTATEVISGEAREFSSYRKNKDIKLVDAIMASSAAPIYFKPWIINDEILADGGVWAKNPSVLGVMEALSKTDISMKNIKMLSIGTGRKPSYYKDLKTEDSKNNWGINKWGPGFVGLVSGIQANEPDYLLRNSLKEESYLRLNFTSPKKVRLDAIKTSDLEILEREAYTTYQLEKENIFKLLNNNLE